MLKISLDRAYKYANYGSMDAIAQVMHIGYSGNKKIKIKLRLLMNREHHDRITIAFDSISFNTTMGTRIATPHP